MAESEFRLVPRTEIGLPAIVTSTDGVTRRPEIGNCRYYTGHYTGVPVIYGDIGDTPDEIRGIHSYSIRAKKAFEYNYVIGMDNDNLVYEYAGPYRAAHSAGENGISIGVLFLIGTNEYPTDVMVRKWQWLRGVLRYFKILQDVPEQRPHGEMPGAATSCFGKHLYARWSEMQEPYIPSGTLPPPVTPPEPPPSPGVPFDPAQGVYGLWPLNTSKPRLTVGATGDAVRYLQGVISNEAGGDIAVDGQFGAQTKRRVTEVQQFFRQYDASIVVDGIVGSQTWALIDGMAVVQPAPEPTPPPAPPVEPEPTPEPTPPSNGDKVTTGLFTVKPGDSPWKVSTLFYGTGQRWPEIVAANEEDPIMNPGDVWKIPGFTGTVIEIQKGWGAYSAIRAAGYETNNDGITKFYNWNGGEDRVLQPGDKVFVQD